jgi:phosphoglucosamine mutase
VVDGDHIIAMCAGDLRERGRLRDDTVVVTVMTNLGFRLAMRAAGIDVVETPVGDRYVLEALAAGGYSLGGEQSRPRHLHRSRHHRRRLLTGARAARRRPAVGETAVAARRGAMTQLPQVLINIPVAERRPDIAAELADEIAAAQAELGETGRILVRASGTEPLVRVMVEAATAAQAQAAADRLATLVH